MYNVHTDFEGNKTKLCDLGSDHLRNIISYIEKRAKKGVLLRFGGTDCTGGNFWYDEEIIYGKEARERLNYRYYVEEIKKRIN